MNTTVVLLNSRRIVLSRLSERVCVNTSESWCAVMLNIKPQLKIGTWPCSKSRFTHQFFHTPPLCWWRWTPRSVLAHSVGTLYHLRAQNGRPGLVDLVGLQREEERGKGAQQHAAHHIEHDHDVCAGDQKYQQAYSRTSKSL